jgi:acyl-CoA thioester hydrolase
VSLLYTHRVEVRFADCDPLGHVNNAVYLSYLEQARFGLWRRLWGFNGETAMTAAGGAGLILARVECDYRVAATYGDVLDVKLGLAGIGRTSFTYEYEVVDPEKSITVAEARTVIVLYDYRHSKPVPIDDARRADLMRSFT